MITFRICQPLLVCQFAQLTCLFLVIPQIIFEYLTFLLLLLASLISKCKHGKGLILSFLSPVGEICVSCFWLPWYQSTNMDKVWFCLFFLLWVKFVVCWLFLASQIGMCSLCLVNLHCVEFWSEAISKQPDAVLYKIGKTESQISILRSAPQIYFHIFQSPLPAIF